jgi:predicted DNA-binding WGR domain protein
MTLAEARRKFHSNQPWKIRLEFRGSNYNNASGQSSKWWEARGDGGKEAGVNWGKIGSSGRSTPVLKSASDILYDTAPDKIREGYVEVNLNTPLKSTVKLVPLELLALPEPYSLIRMIILSANTFRAYDEVGNFLLQFEEAGAMALIEKGQFTRISDTWRL